MFLSPLSCPGCDEATQLTREDNAALNKSFTYTYDKGGNIVSKSEYEFTTGTLGAATDTIDYAYDVTWKDELTEYDGMSIAYNEIGNPLTYGDDISYLWDGRELIRHQDEESEITVHMGYNADGLRTLKTVIDFSSLPWTMDYYSYTWSADGTLLGYSVKTYTNESIADVWIIYGENGDAVGFTVKDYEGVEPETYTYYYIKNAQGDVLRVVDETGATMADYTYDAWGNFTYTADANAGANADIIERYNPVTYRGYYYDNDLEMYYLRSRYYNPQWGRFLNADEQLNVDQSVLGANLFAYCINNPVNMADCDGRIGIILTLTGASIILATSILALSAVAVFVSPQFQRLWAQMCTAIGTMVLNDLRSMGGTMSTLAVVLASKAKAIYKSVAISYAKSKTIPKYRSEREWHHLVAQKAPNASYAAKILREIFPEKGTNDPKNLRYIKTGLHRRLHTNTYYGWANSVVISAYKAANGDTGQQEVNVKVALEVLGYWVMWMDKLYPSFP